MIFIRDLVREDARLLQEQLRVNVLFTTVSPEGHYLNLPK